MQGSAEATRRKQERRWPPEGPEGRGMGGGEGWAVHGEKRDPCVLRGRAEPPGEGPCGGRKGLDFSLQALGSHGRLQSRMVPRSKGAEYRSMEGGARGWAAGGARPARQRGRRGEKQDSVR